MKKMLLIVLVVVISVYWVLRSYFPNVEINHYDAVGTVQENGVMEKGWVPKILPPSAYDIVETHDVDKRSVFGEFSYKEQDEEAFLSQLTVANGIHEGEKFLFKIDREKNRVSFRNRD